MVKAEAIDPALMELDAPPSPQPTPARTRSRAIKDASREPTPSRSAGPPRPAGVQHLSSQPAGPSALLSQTEQLQHAFADPVRQQAQAMDDDADEDKDREELDEETLATMMYNQELLRHMTAKQVEQFEAYRRSGLKAAAVRKLVQHTDHQINAANAQLVAGIAKVFIGELVAKARSAQESSGQTGSLSPDHLREAYRLYKTETGNVGSAKSLRGKRLFRR